MGCPGAAGSNEESAVGSTVLVPYHMEEAAGSTVELCRILSCVPAILLSDKPKEMLLLSVSYCRSFLSLSEAEFKLVTCILRLSASPHVLAWCYL